MKPIKIKKRLCSDKDCDNYFYQYKTTDKYCSYTCKSKHFKSLKKTPLKIKAKKNEQYIKKIRDKVALKSNDKKAKKETKLYLFKKEFDKQRNKIKKRIKKDNNGYIICEKCKTKSSIQFSTHHIIFRSERPFHDKLNNPKNLIHLCYDCHEGFHKEKRSRNYLIKNRELTNLFGRIWGYDE